MRHLKPNLGRKMPLGLVLAAALGVSASHAGSNTDGTKAQQRAQTVKPNAIIIYTLPNCAYCTQAKRWLSANHFAFTIRCRKPATSGGAYKAIVKCDKFCYAHLTIFNVLHSTVKLRLNCEYAVT